jgi:hypothetical protein
MLLLGFLYMLRILDFPSNLLCRTNQQLANDLLNTINYVFNRQYRGQDRELADCDKQSESHHPNGVSLLFTTALVAHVVGVY